MVSLNEFHCFISIGEGLVCLTSQYRVHDAYLRNIQDDESILKYTENVIDAIEYTENYTTLLKNQRTDVHASCEHNPLYYLFSFTLKLVVSYALKARNIIFYVHIHEDVL